MSKITVKEYQDMVRENRVTSGEVELLPLLDGPVTMGVYMTRSGGVATIKGITTCGSAYWALSGIWYEATTGRALRASGFDSLHKKIRDQ